MWKKPDAFCQKEVIERQKVASAREYGHDYHVLHDATPKGIYKRDPHFLIVPAGNEGHCDGVNFPVPKSFGMLTIAQKVMRMLEKNQYHLHNVLLERTGKLASVKHKHVHVIARHLIPEWPTTSKIQKVSNFFETFKNFLRQLLPSSLSTEELKYRIKLFSEQLKPMFE